MAQGRMAQVPAHAHRPEGIGCAAASSPKQQMAPMMKSTVMTKSALTAALAESCEVKRGVISTALSTLASIATNEAKKNGKVVMVKAKPAKTIVKAFPAKALKDEF